MNDRTFSKFSCEPSLLGISDPESFKKSGRTCSVKLDYGVTGDCLDVSCHPRKGILKIDLQGTGLIVSPSVSNSFNIFEK